MRATTLWCCVCISAFAAGAAPDSGIVLTLRPVGAEPELIIQNNQRLPVAGQFKEYSVERSADLHAWESAGVRGQGSVGAQIEQLRLTVPTVGSSSFYRVFSTVVSSASADTFPDAVYGIASRFHEELAALGQLPLAEFERQYPAPPYLPQIGFDVTTAEYWPAFNLDPTVHNATNWVDPRFTDFRLNAREFAMFQTNGFVVSPRLGSRSFATTYYQIFTDDLPVYISADSALQAWHFSYSKLLQYLEERWIRVCFTNVLAAMQDQLPTLKVEAEGTPLEPAVVEADVLLGVAYSLGSGNIHPGRLGNQSRIASLLSQVTGSGFVEVQLYGAPRGLDTSFLKPRGHYVSTQTLSNYFRGFTWCAMADCRFASTNHLELASSVALTLLLERSGQLTNWVKMDALIRNFVGPPDSLGPAQLGDILHAAGITGAVNLASSDKLAKLHEQLMSGQYGVQHVRNSLLLSPLSREQLQLPRAFTLFSQRFTPDSWALTKVVFDDIIWDENGIPGLEDKILRRVPSVLDVAFSVLGNNSTAPLISGRITDTAGHPWRDGKPYQHNLAAVRRTMDAQGAEIWTNNVYWTWLAALRELSKPVTPAFPQAMQTRAWAMKDLSAQLSGWTQLRHDNLLYTKQSTTPGIICLYPDFYVEPRPEFWARMKQLPLITATSISDLGLDPRVRLFLENFASTMDILRGVAEKELTMTPLTPAETYFLGDLIEDMAAYSSGGRTYSGWYPALFFNDPQSMLAYGHGEGSDQFDALVVDVHTDYPADLVGDPGSILHNAVGAVNLLMIAVDCGPGDIAIYAGPVLSHYEFEQPSLNRLTDSEWMTMLQTSPPAPPSWTSSFLAVP